MSRYIWQPRQKSKAALRNAARQGERGEDDPRAPAAPAAKPIVPIAGEHHAHALGEAGRRLRLGLGRRPEPWPDQVTEDEPVGGVAQAGQRSHGEHQRLREQQPASRGANAAVTRTTASTTVVIAAPKRGPRESMVMVCSQTQVRCRMFLRLPAAEPARVRRRRAPGRVHIAVATRQKSTARRLVAASALFWKTRTPDAMSLRGRTAVTVGPVTRDAGLIVA